LAISNVNGEALNPMIDKAIAAGIPTVTFNSEAEGSKRMAFFGRTWSIQEGCRPGSFRNIWDRAARF
jgi:ABC-type sugar transport system substrate-binding protein